MVPTVSCRATSGDKRKDKSVQWAEAKISLAHVAGSKEMSFAATLQGDVQDAGKHLRKCARRVGFGKGHRVHGVGDGAPWIARQIKNNFGQQGSYLVDFFHVGDYLSAAAQGIATQQAEQQALMNLQKEPSRPMGSMPCSTSCKPIWSRQMRLRSSPLCVGAGVTSVSAKISLTMPAPSARACQSAQARSKAPTAIWCKNA